MNIKVDAIQTMMNIPESMSIPPIQQATAQHDHLKQLKGQIIIGWPENKDQIPQEIRTSWMSQDDMVVINGIIMKGRHAIIHKILKTQALDQLHVNHMGIGKNQTPGMQIHILV